MIVILDQIAHTATEIALKASTNMQQDQKQRAPLLSPPPASTWAENYVVPLFLFLLALTSNLSTCGTYYRSADDFPGHMRWQNETIDRLQQPTDGPLLALILLGCGSLLVTNLSALPHRLYQYFHLNVAPSPTTASNFCQGIDIVSAGFKTLISSTSLLALFTDGAESPLLWLGVAIALFTFIGNGFANLSNFWEPFGFRANVFNTASTAKFMSHYSAGSYSLSQTALYFNQFDAGFDHAGWLQGRLSAADSTIKIVLLSLAIASSLNFCVKSYNIYQPKIFQLLTQADPIDIEQPGENSERTKAPAPIDSGATNYCQRLTCDGAWSTVWKVLVISLVTIGIFNENDLYDWGLGLAAFTLLGNLLTHLTYYSAADYSAAEQNQSTDDTAAISARSTA